MQIKIYKEINELRNLYIIIFFYYLAIYLFFIYLLFFYLFIIFFFFFLVMILRGEILFFLCDFCYLQESNFLYITSFNKNSYRVFYLNLLNE